MKNNDNTALLAHKRRVDAERKAAAIARRENSNKSAMHAVAKAK